MSNFTSYPLLKNAIIEMAYDNGVINRTESEEKFLTRMEGLIFGEDGFPEDEIYQAESELSEIDNEEDFLTFINDGEQYAQDHGENPHPHAEAMLTAIFDML